MTGKELIKALHDYSGYTVDQEAAERLLRYYEETGDLSFPAHVLHLTEIEAGALLRPDEA